jgi:hypothetical protein
MTPSHTQYSRTLSQQLQGRRQSRRRPVPWHEAALVLLRLALDPARLMLRTLYAAYPRGRPPCDPVCVLRAFLLMLLLHSKSLLQRAHALRTHPRLAQIAGFAPFETPAVGTFYALLNRLADGPYAPSYAHRVRPRCQRKGRHRRHLHQDQAQRHAAQVRDASQADTVTE